MRRSSVWASRCSSRAEVMMPLLGRMYVDFVGVGRSGRTSDWESMGSSSSISSSSLVDVGVWKWWPVVTEE